MPLTVKKIRFSGRIVSNHHDGLKCTNYFIKMTKIIKLVSIGEY